MMLKLCVRVNPSSPEKTRLDFKNMTSLLFWEWNNNRSERPQNYAFALLVCRKMSKAQTWLNLYDMGNRDEDRGKNTEGRWPIV